MFREHRLLFWYWFLLVVIDPLNSAAVCFWRVTLFKKSWASVRICRRAHDGMQAVEEFAALFRGD